MLFLNIFFFLETLNRISMLPLAQEITFIINCDLSLIFQFYIHYFLKGDGYFFIFLLLSHHMSSFIIFCLPCIFSLLYQLCLVSFHKIEGIILLNKLNNIILGYLTLQKCPVNNKLNANYFTVYKKFYTVKPDYFICLFFLFSYLLRFGPLKST